MKVERRIVRNSQTVRMNLPKAFIEKLGIEINNIVNVELKKGRIVITPKKEEDDNVESTK